MPEKANKRARPQLARGKRGYKRGNRRCSLSGGPSAESHRDAGHDIHCRGFPDSGSVRAYYPIEIGGLKRERYSKQGADGGNTLETGRPKLKAPRMVLWLTPFAGVEHCAIECLYFA
jgi:hypothetical protein